MKGRHSYDGMRRRWRFGFQVEKLCGPTGKKKTVDGPARFKKDLQTYINSLQPVSNGVLQALAACGASDRANAACSLPAACNLRRSKC